MNSRCLARQVSDQKSCAPCGLLWDMNDPEPPPCPLDAPSMTDDADFEPLLRTVLKYEGPHSEAYAALLRAWKRCAI